MRVKGFVQTPAGQLITGVRITDGTHNFASTPTLTFNPAYFYLTQTSAAQPMVNVGGFKAVYLTASTPLTSLVSGNPSVTINWTTFQDGYDYGGWYSSGSPTLVTVPAGVTMVILWGMFNYNVTGTPANSGWALTGFRLNGALGTPALRMQSALPNAASITEPIQAIYTYPIKVKPGDTLAPEFAASWTTATGVTVSGNWGVHALPV